MIFKEVRFWGVRFSLNFLRTNLRFLTASLQLSLNQGFDKRLKFPVDLGIVSDAISSNLLVKNSAGLTSFLIVSTFSCLLHNSLKVPHSALWSFHLGKTRVGKGCRNCRKTGKWSLPQRSSHTVQWMSWVRQGEQSDKSKADDEPVAGWM